MATQLEQNLSDIQGIILSGYAHLNEATYLFLKVDDAAKGRAWLKRVAGGISNAEPWAVDPANGQNQKPVKLTNIAFTCPGLAALGVPSATLDSFSDEFKQGPFGKERTTMMGDIDESAPENWEWGASLDYQPHVMLMLFGATPEILQAHEDDHLKILAEVGGLTVTWTQDTSRLPDSKEHFGFRDGISQPSIEGSPYRAAPGNDIVKPGEFILGYLNEYGLVPPMPDHIGQNGTYLVYRKLEQNVALFNQFIAEQANGDPAAADWLSARFIGRWKSGAPLALTPDADKPQVGEDNKHNNDFKYHDTDPYGYNTPISAHTRRTNPRDGLEHDPVASQITINRHRIIRRGRPFGPPYGPDTAKAQRGTLFIALNTDIKRQFEFIQQVWVNNAKFAGQYTDQDPILGDRNKGNDSLTLQRWPIRKQITGLKRFITVRTAGYFFVPGLKGLNYIANLE
jgi:Dyp-type peroxidase family